ncbi:MAG: DNA repair protein RecN [Clostridia bacterium]|nr:DNA repair protein RecN [Clostridia bacterium]
MLLELNIANIALIESLRIEFAQGFNVLTGETGSGKSIVVDCMNLVLGGRADRDFVRTGAEKGSVQALFDIAKNSAARAILGEMDIDCEDGMVAVSREISRSGRNICRISGVIVPLNTLRRLTGTLLDIHGQHEHQSLLDPAKHIAFLDAYGDNRHTELRAQAAKLHSERVKMESELKKNMLDAAERERLSDMLGFQIQEIASAKLKKGEEERLIARLRILENSEKIRTNVETAYEATYAGAGRTPSAQELLLRAANAMDKLSQIDERYAELGLRLREMVYSVQDIGYELRDILDHMESDPGLIEKVSKRLETIDRLERKYGPNLDDVLNFYASAVERLESIQTGDAHIDALKAELAKKDAELDEVCTLLTASRRELAQRLAQAVMQQLRDLGMGRARLEIRIESLPRPTANGLDSVEFLISANPGEPLKPMASVASGGELSRIMLALKAISMEADGVDSMVFDEIDTGVSGRMAQTVGEKMCAIARDHQVLCVTHLPQIAALGDAHFVVEKHTDGTTTETLVRQLDSEGRIHELSRLVGGAEDSTSSLSHAKHMLEDAECVRRKLH